MQAIDLDINLLDKAIDRMMPELGFGPDDNDSEHASSGLHSVTLSMSTRCTGLPGRDSAGIQSPAAGSSPLVAQAQGN